MIKTKSTTQCHVSPQVLLQSMVERTSPAQLSAQTKKAFVQLREAYLELIFVIGNSLKQSHSTVHLAARYFDRVLAKLATRVIVDF